MFEKLKSVLLDDLYFAAILVIIVGVASFGLGRLSVFQSMKSKEVAAGQSFAASSVIIDQSGRDAEAGLSTAPATTTPQILAPTTQNFVASKNGSKYHRLDCPGAKQMAEQNKIYFTTIDEARAAGYLPAANCKDLQ